jgi:hypothetical protein
MGGVVVIEASALPKEITMKITPPMAPDAEPTPFPVGLEVLNLVDRISYLFDLHVSAAHRAIDQAFVAWECRGARVPELEIAVLATQGALEVYSTLQGRDARADDMCVKLEALYSKSLEHATEMTTSDYCEDFNQAAHMEDVEVVAKLLDISLPVFAAIQDRSANRYKMEDRLSVLLEFCMATSGEALERESGDATLRQSRINEMAISAKATNLAIRVLAALGERDWKPRKLQ